MYLITSGWFRLPTNGLMVIYKYVFTLIFSKLAFVNYLFNFSIN